MANKPSTPEIGPASEPPRRGQGFRLESLDTWMAANPWHPRLVPFLVYVAMLGLIRAAKGWDPRLYPVMYAVQCGVVLWLLWRYRRLLPELNVKFHWIGVVVGVAIGVAWIGIGLGLDKTAAGKWLMTNVPDWYGKAEGENGDDKNFFVQMGRTVGWVSMVLRLLGMSIVVPLFEELFVRSLLLRSLSSFRVTGIGLIQLAQDVPVVGEWVMHSKMGRRAGRHEAVFGAQFDRTAVGRLTGFGVAASTAVFVLHHAVRDWPGAVVCGLAYCGVVWATNRGGKMKGLGPVVWAHGITNAMLWVYTIKTNDWQFF